MGGSEFQPLARMLWLLSPWGLYFSLAAKGLFPDPQKAKSAASLKSQDLGRCSWEAVGGGEGGEWGTSLSSRGLRI